MNILIACSEAVPYAKTGGLADVTGALVREFRRRKHKASLIMPLYASIRGKFNLQKTGKTIRVPMGNFALEGAIYTTGKGKVPEAYFIECNQLFDRPELYGTASGEYGDNAVRFIFFCRAVLEVCLALDIHPDILHCNDWQTGLIPLYIKSLYRHHRQFSRTATLFTVHNLAYQGNYEAANMTFTGLGWDYFVPERLEFFGTLSFMKAGLLYADLLNTVSETYSREILDPEHGCSMDGLLRKRRQDLYGIINGIDNQEWDPQQDTFLPSTYNAKDLRGKAVCRERLVRLAGFKDRKAPVVSIVSRLSYQKGLDLILQSLDELVRLGANILVLGKGEELYQAALTAKAEEHRGKVYLYIGFEEPFAHRIYAGSDLFLMPSRYEPCGIGQLIAMKYGTIPIVRKTGGLADTIHDYDHLAGRGTGFLFEEYASRALLEAAKRAFCVYADRKKMQELIRQAMEMNFSWEKAAGEYLDVYRKAGEKRLT
ncbi:MAG: glycogen synthase GlgA [Nitrospirae bacterium]|nr:glycogen synthase GlgA [Nitrospirota bacterium]